MTERIDMLEWENEPIEVKPKPKVDKKSKRRPIEMQSNPEAVAGTTLTEESLHNAFDSIWRMSSGEAQEERARMQQQMLERQMLLQQEREIERQRREMRNLVAQPNPEADNPFGEDGNWFLKRLFGR